VDEKLTSSQQTLERLPFLRGRTGKSLFLREGGIANGLYGMTILDKTESEKKGG
jgi:hypothetical protein